jgi:diguanylate cyclase
MSAVITSTHEIARQTLRLLAARRIAPTPENYRELYAEAAGAPEFDAIPASEKALRRLVAEFPRSTPDLIRVANALTAAVNSRNWDEIRTRLVDFARDPHAARELLPVVVSVRRDAQAGPANGDDSARELLELLAQTLDLGVAARLVEQPELAGEVKALALRLRAHEGPPAPAALRSQLKSLWLKIELQAGPRGAVQEGLLRLLRLLVDNVGELVVDDQWLRGQIAVVQQAISGPLSLEALGEAERNLKDVLYKQSLLKVSLIEAKASLKQMVASFIDQLGQLSESTGDYHDTMESLAQQVRQTEDMGRLKELMDEIMRETRTVQASTLRAREEVLAARRAVDAAERKISDLETELAQASATAREDHLTGTLNRRGLNEAFERELAAVQRTSRPLSIALLDIDNLHDLNDKHGRQAGDDALAHLAAVIKETVRPTDVVARFRAQEFLLLLPGSDIGQGVDVMVRLQRELTKRFFLHDNNRLLITFSAGVAAYASGDSQADAVKRVEAALHRAKRSGRNQVAAVS